MKPEQEHNLADANRAFLKLSDEKYRAGQAEHQGNLWEVPHLIDELQKEIVDAWHYSFNLKNQIIKLQQIIDDLQHKE